MGTRCATPSGGTRRGPGTLQSHARGGWPVRRPKRSAPDALGVRGAGRRAAHVGAGGPAAAGCGGGGVWLPRLPGGICMSVCGCPRLPASSTLQVRAGRAGLAGGRRAEPREPLHPDAATGSWAAPPSAPVAASPPRPRRALCSEPLLAPGSSSSAPNPATRR